MSLPKAAIRPSNHLGKVEEVVNCSVFSAPNSRAAVSLSYLAARVSSKCCKNVKSCDRPDGQPSFNVIIFELQSLYVNGLGKSWLVRCWQHRAVAQQSSLVTYDCSIAATLSSDCCKVLSPQLFKISTMSSRSVKSAFDFLRLAGELAENCGRAPARKPPCWEVSFFWYALVCGLSPQVLYQKKDNRKPWFDR
jgi:hypothetical protein